MKAKIIASGVITEVCECNAKHKELGYDYMSVYNGYAYKASELEIYEEPGYWEKLKHQYAGMAMQGIMNNDILLKFFCGENKEITMEEIINVNAVSIATALVEKLKQEK